MKVKQLRTTPYHPQCDGQTERVNQTVINILSCYTNKYQTNWDLILPLVMYAVRSTPHEATGETPNMGMFGRETNLPIDLELQPPTYQYMDEKEQFHFMREKMPEIWKDIRDKIQFHQEAMKALYDKTAKPHNIKVGDKVMINIPQFVPNTVAKLRLPFKGPFIVVATTPTNIKAVWEDDPLKKSVYVHANKCKPIVNNSSKRKQPETLAEDAEVVDRKVRTKENQPYRDYPLRSKLEKPQINMISANTYDPQRLPYATYSEKFYDHYGLSRLMNEEIYTDPDAITRTPPKRRRLPLLPTASNSSNYNVPNVTRITEPESQDPAMRQIRQYR